MIPLSGDEIATFTPDSLKNIVPTPLFRFRPPTIRDRNRFWHLLERNGIAIHQDDEVRAEMLRVVDANWSPEQAEPQKSLLLTFWAKLEQQRPDQPRTYTDEELNAYEAFAAELARISPVLAAWKADNNLFHKEAPYYALQMFLVGWSNIDVPFAIEGGLVSFEKLADLANAIVAVETKAEADKVEGVFPGFGFLQLSGHAFSLLTLDRDAEKNSDAPSASSGTLNGTKSPPLAEPSSDGARASTKPTNSRKAKTPPASSPAAIST